MRRFGPVQRHGALIAVHSRRAFLRLVPLILFYKNGSDVGRLASGRLLTGGMRFAG